MIDSYLSTIPLSSHQKTMNTKLDMYADYITLGAYAKTLTLVEQKVSSDAAINTEQIK